MMIMEPIQVLLIEDNPGDARLIEYMLQEADEPGFVLHWANRLSAGLEQLAAGHFSVVLLDLALPDSQGSDTFTRVHTQAPEIPVIILTGLDDLALATALMREGAEDYLVKGQVGGALLVRSIRYAIESKRAKQQIRYQAQLLQSVSDSVIATDADSRITSWNNAALEMYGWSEQEALGRYTNELLASEFFGGSRENAVASLMRDGFWKGEIRQRRKDGSTLWVSAATSLLRNTIGQSVGAVSANRDITDRKRMEEELHLTNAQLQAIFQAIPDLFFILADDGTVTDWKGGKANPFLPPESFLGCKLHEVLPAGVGEKAKQALEKVVAEREIQLAEFSVPVAGGELSFETWLCPLEVGSVLAIVRNVTDRKQLDQAIQKARSDLLFSVSHEMKTPLMNIAAAREMLATLPETERQNRFLEYERTWDRNLRRLRRLIDNLVDSQRVQTNGLKLLKAPCDLPAVIHRVLEEEAVYAATRKVCLVERMNTVPLMDLDEETIERLVENLVTNAIKYSLPDGRVEIVLEQKIGEVALSVTDYGCGIPTGEQAALFKPFQRSSEAVRKGTPGTGLGLYVAKFIAEAHGGSIELQSMMGEGTVVTVRIPLPEQAA